MKFFAGILIFATVVLCLGAPRAEATDAAYQNNMRTARILISRGDAQRALTIYDRILREHPLDSRASVGKTEALIELKRYEEAESFLEAALERIEANADIYRARVMLRRAQENWDEAFADVMRVVTANEERATWAMAEARDLLEEGLTTETARERALTMRQENPTTLTFTLLSAMLAVFDGEPEAGLALVIETETAQELKGSLLSRYAEELTRLGRDDYALDALQTAATRTAHAAHRSKVLFRVAEIQEDLDRYEDALATLAVIVEERAGTATSGKALLASADIHQKYLDDPEEALTVYLQIQDDPILGHHRPDMLLQMGDCYLRLGRFDQAGAAYESVMPDAIDPEQAEKASFKLAETAFFAGHPDSAMELYQTMAETYPRSMLADDAAGRFIMLNKYLLVGAGVANQVLGRMEWARMAGDSAAVDSTARLLIDNYGEGELGAEAWFARADMARAGGSPDLALEYLEQITAVFADDVRRAPAALMAQGNILLHELGRPQEALLRFETILTDYPNSLPAGEARRQVEALRRDLKL